MKRSFTLFEIIISIILISIIYMFAINSFTHSNNTAKTLNLKNLKSKLMSYNYKNKVTIRCIKDDLSCFIFLDDETIPQDEKIENLFQDEPNIYTYDSSLDKIEFPDLELEQLQRYEIFFEFNCYKNNNCDELVLELPNKVFVFNNLFLNPIELKYLSDVDDLRENKIQEVRDAF